MNDATPKFNGNDATPDYAKDWEEKHKKWQEEEDCLLAERFKNGFTASNTGDSYKQKKLEELEDKITKFVEDNDLGVMGWDESGMEERHIKAVALFVKKEIDKAVQQAQSEIIEDITDFIRRSENSWPDLPKHTIKETKNYLDKIK